LLFLPLLGGYVFYCKWNGLKFYAARCSGQRIIFHAAVFGLVFLVAARLLVMATPKLADLEVVLAPNALLVVLGAMLVLFFALCWVAFDAIRDENLKQELGTQKPAMGLMIAAILLAAGGLLLHGIVDDSWLQLISLIVFNALCIAAVSALATRGIRWYMDSLEPDLTRQFPARAIFLRVSLFVVVVSLAALVWCTTAIDADEYWSEFSPYENSGTAFLACMLGALTWVVLNLVYPYQVASARLYKNLQTNSLEHLFYRSALDEDLLQLTLKDGKVYVGYIASVPQDPAAPDAYVRVLPTKSGYRDSNTKKVTFTTFYEEAYLGDNADADDFVKVVPVTNIDSASIFREDVYRKFIESRSEGVVPAADATERRAV